MNTMKKILVIIPVILLLNSCSNLKCIATFRSSDLVKATIYNEKENPESFIFEVKNTSNNDISFPYDMNIHGNKFIVYSPSGKPFNSTSGSGNFIKIKPKDSYKINIKRFKQFLYYGLQAKETGTYRCIWKNEHFNFELEFDYYYDYEKAKPKKKK